MKFGVLFFHSRSGLELYQQPNRPLGSVVLLFLDYLLLGVRAHTVGAMHTFCTHILCLFTCFEANTQTHKQKNNGILTKQNCYQTGQILIQTVDYVFLNKQIALFIFIEVLFLFNSVLFSSLLCLLSIHSI